MQTKNVLTLDRIGITTSGNNYTSPPRVLVVGKPNILARTTLSGTSVDTVSIVTNDSGLSEDIRILPVTNCKRTVEFAKKIISTFLPLKAIQLVYPVKNLNIQFLRMMEKNY